MKRVLFVSTVMWLLIFVLSGCGMMGMHGLSGMSHHSMTKDEVMAIKQFNQNGLSGELAVPPLVAGEPGLIRLLINEKTGPVSNALVDFTFQEEIGEFAETLQVAGGVEGVYEVEYTPESTGTVTNVAENYGLPQADPVRVHLEKDVRRNNNTR